MKLISHTSIPEPETDLLSMPLKTCIVVVGPTAVGKTSLAISLAQYFTTEIISADSRQCYRELNIGVATPSLEQLQQVKHYFIQSHSIQDEVNAAIFENYALKAADIIFQKNDYAVVVGGTGLYVKAFCEGLDEIPAIDENIRNQIIQQYQEKGISWLQEQVSVKDPVYFSSGEIQNPQRLMRALEVVLSTGKSIRSYQRQQPRERDFRIIKTGLELPREQLYQNVNHRVDEMIKQGLIDEVKGLFPLRKLNALQTVGYSELFAWLDEKISLEEAIEEIKMNTRHYAKRQLTWFKKDSSIEWFHPSSFDTLKNFVTGKLD